MGDRLFELYVPKLTGLVPVSTMVESPVTDPVVVTVPVARTLPMVDDRGVELYMVKMSGFASTCVKSKAPGAELEDMFMPVTSVDPQADIGIIGE